MTEWPKTTVCDGRHGRFHLPKPFSSKYQFLDLYTVVYIVYYSSPPSQLAGAFVCCPSLCHWAILWSWYFLNAFVKTDIEWWRWGALSFLSAERANLIPDWCGGEIKTPVRMAQSNTSPLSLSLPLRLCEKREDYATRTWYSIIFFISYYHHCYYYSICLSRTATIVYCIYLFFFASWSPTAGLCELVRRQWQMSTGIGLFCSIFGTLWERCLIYSLTVMYGRSLPVFLAAFNITKDIV